MGQICSLTRLMLKGFSERQSAALCLSTNSRAEVIVAREKKPEARSKKAQPSDRYLWNRPYHRRTSRRSRARNPPPQTDADRCEQRERLLLSGLNSASSPQSPKNRRVSVRDRRRAGSSYFCNSQASKKGKTPVEQKSTSRISRSRPEKLDGMAPIGDHDGIRTRAAECFSRGKSGSSRRANTCAITDGEGCRGSCQLPPTEKLRKHKPRKFLARRSRQLIL